MATNIKSAADEEEEEEEEGPIINVHHRKLIYKVNPMYSSDHPATSAHLVSQSASTHSSSSYSKSSSYMAMMQGTVTSSLTEHFTGQSLLPETAHHTAISPSDYTQQSRLQTVIIKGAEQFRLPDTDREVSYHHDESYPEQAFNFADQDKQQSDIYHKTQRPDVPVKIGTSFDGKNIIAESSIDEEFDESFTMPRDFTAHNQNPISTLNYDEMRFEELRDSGLSGTQHASLFGHAAENSFTFEASDSGLLDGKLKSEKRSSKHNPKYHVIMGLSLNGQMIFDGLRTAVSEPLSTDENSLHVYVNEGNVSTPQILEDLNERPTEGFEHVVSNKVIAGLTAQSEFVVAGLTKVGPDDQAGDLNEQHAERTEYAISNKVIGCLTAQNELVITGLIEGGSEDQARRFASVIAGLTTDGQVICGGCVFDSASGCTSGKSSEHYHSPLDIMANLTAQNEMVLGGLSLDNDLRPHSSISAVPEAADTNLAREYNQRENAEALIRRDSF